jgi:tubulin polyglutamylase TTLL6/13
MCFEILGFDIFIDHNAKPWLIEVNHAPSFNIDTPIDQKVKTQLVKDTFSLIDVTHA